MKAIKVVLFDLGNVLVDLGDISDFAAIFQVDTQDEAVMWERWLKSSAVKAFDTGQINLSDFIQSLRLEMGATDELEGLKQAFVKWPKGLFSGVSQLIERIPPNYHRAILSNTNDAHWGRIMDEMGLSGCFHSYFASHQIGIAKPDLAVYEYVIRELGVAADSILFLDDNLINVQAARKLGMQSEHVKGVECAEKILYKYKVIS
ncbi:HAD family phosphatase [Marinomonas piezotolerans]|uniref:HAD family phosphatase n=1 Tax=Marinomonas piezotolerans TaxID=2213058 RepID=A0A370U840_9GAMM|nr:HAD family phosphatase [Marinomonas piezotolerans]RDL43960.1 HAD family phosphatase [Marinomonas piezotolerans]